MSLNLKNWTLLPDTGDPAFGDWCRDGASVSTLEGVVDFQGGPHRVLSARPEAFEQAIRDLAGVEELPEPIGMTGVVNFSEDVSLHSDRDGHYVCSRRTGKRWPVNNWSEGIVKVRELLGLP